MTEEAEGSRILSVEKELQLHWSEHCFPERAARSECPDFVLEVAREYPLDVPYTQTLSAHNPIPLQC